MSITLRPEPFLIDSMETHISQREKFIPKILPKDWKIKNNNYFYPAMYYVKLLKKNGLLDTKIFHFQLIQKDILHIRFALALGIL